jgi:hypothetical protein
MLSFLAGRKIVPVETQHVFNDNRFAVCNEG